MGPQLAEYFGVDHSVLMTTIAAESVTAETGLQVGDVLTAIDGESVDDGDALHRMVAAIAAPATVKLEMSRDGVTLTLSARFEKMPRRGQSVGERVIHEPAPGRALRVRR